MKGCAQAASRIAAVILAVAFVVTLPLSLVAFNLGRIAFSPERMTTLLLETVDETGGLRRLVIESLTTDASAGEPGGPDLAETLAFLSPQERDELGERLTPPGWAEEQIGSVMAGIYAWIDNDRAQPTLAVDITDLKVALLSGGASDLVEIVVDSWPPCTVAEIAEMGVGALLGEQSLKLCEPPEPLRSGLVGIINASVSLSLRALPDQITLGPATPGPASAEVMQGKERLRLARFLAGWSWLLSPVMLGLVMALAIRSWRSLGLWWGIPLTVGAMLTLATMVGVRVAVEAMARSALGEATMPVWIEGMIHTLITAMIVVVFRRVAFQAGILLVAGGVVLAGGLLVQRSVDRRGAPPAQAPERQSSQGTVRLEPIEAKPAEPEEPPAPGGTPSGMFG